MLLVVRLRLKSCRISKAAHIVYRREEFIFFILNKMFVFTSLEPYVCLSRQCLHLKVMCYAPWSVIVPHVLSHREVYAHCAEA